MNEAIEVDATFEADGAIQPRAFLWRGHRHTVTSLGRQWEEAGERRFLVMTAGDRVYDLAYLPQEGAWRLRRKPQDFGGPGKAV